MSAAAITLNSEQLRRRDLYLIHKGKATIGWTEAEYRAELQSLTGKSSAADLDAAGRRKVLDHLKSKGAMAPSKPFDQAAKIEWLWRKLGQANALSDASRKALMAFVGRTAGIEVSDLKFLPVREASKVIEALKAWLKRATKGKRP